MVSVRHFVLCSQWICSRYINENVQNYLVRESMAIVCRNKLLLSSLILKDTVQ
jgi:hypothetical protein